MKRIKPVVNKLLYKSIFLHSSHQFNGNTLNYFVKHTEKLVVFIIMPRVKNTGNVVRLYRSGKLIEEKKFLVSENVFLYYIGWYFQYMKTLWGFFSRGERFYAICFHPIFFFGMSIQKIFRDIEYVYWIGDYFPGNNRFIVLFERLKKFYHDRISFTCYLSDTINKIMNGKVQQTSNRKTVMWGVDPKKIARSDTFSSFTILFVGLIKKEQGLEFFYSFLRNHKEYKVNILGVCHPGLYKEHRKIIKEYGIDKQVYFPNRFFSDNELNTISKKCQVAIALYDKDPMSPTMYTDPGKVKAYTELGLPLIMSDVSAIAPFVKKFHCGEVVERNEQSISNALQRMRKDYKKYLAGIKKFNEYFYFETYYRERFEFLRR